MLHLVRRGSDLRPVPATQLPQSGTRHGRLYLRSQALSKRSHVGGLPPASWSTPLRHAWVAAEVFESSIDALGSIPSPPAVALTQDGRGLGRVLNQISHAPHDEVVGLFFVFARVRVPAAVLRLLAVVVDEQLGRLVALAHRSRDREVKVWVKAEGPSFAALGEDRRQRVSAPCHEDRRGEGRGEHVDRAKSAEKNTYERGQAQDVTVVPIAARR